VAPSAHPCGGASARQGQACCQLVSTVHPPTSGRGSLHGLRSVLPSTVPGDAAAKRDKIALLVVSNRSSELDG
jgi:hypothetical protein